MQIGELSIIDLLHVLNFLAELVVQERRLLARLILGLLTSMKLGFKALSLAADIHYLRVQRICLLLDLPDLDIPVISHLTELFLQFA